MSSVPSKLSPVAIVLKGKFGGFFNLNLIFNKNYVTLTWDLIDIAPTAITAKEGSL